MALVYHEDFVMEIKYIGITTSKKSSQAHINDDHATHIATALTNEGYSVVFYDLTHQDEIARLIQDRKDDKLDMVFNNAAGRRGGDGSIEGLLEMLEIPYVGSDVLATAVAFDKRTTKSVVFNNGVPIIRGLDFSKEQFETQRDWVIGQIEEFLHYPVVVKASQGSDSIGVSLVRKHEHILAALKKAFKEDDYILVEDFVKRSAEVTCLVLGSGEKAYALKPVERVYEGDILQEWTLHERNYRIPDQIDRQTLDLIEAYSVIAHKALACSDYSRSDFLISQSGHIFFLELNAHAGLGKIGPSVFAAQATYGWDHQRLIKEVVHLAASRYKS